MTALIFSLALALGFGSAAVAALPDTVGGHHDIASVHHASSPHDTCTQASCSDQIGGCCSSAAHCGGSGCSAFVAPVGAPGFAHRPHWAWAIAGAQRLEGLDSAVNRHPPRDIA
jgi:hypothetical protein